MRCDGEREERERGEKEERWRERETTWNIPVLIFPHVTTTSTRSYLQRYAALCVCTMLQFERE
jgi:hypothetical protein